MTTDGFQRLFPGSPGITTGAGRFPGRPARPPRRTAAFPAPSEQNKEEFPLKKNNNRGFPLAELLIVVAIIAVLTAVAIPVFTAQLEKSRDATDEANIRAAYAELSAALVSNNNPTDIATDLGKGSFTWTTPSTIAGDYSVSISGKGTNAAWDNIATGDTFSVGKLDVTAVANFTTVTFTVDADSQITDIALS